MQRQLILSSGETGHVHVTVTYLNETFLLPQKTIAKLFGVEMPAISKHLANIYQTRELQAQATICNLETIYKAQIH